MKRIIMKTTLLTLTLCLGSFFGFTQDLVSYKDENGKYGYKDSTGNVLVEPKYDDAYDFSEGLGPVKHNEKWGFIDYKGTVVIPFKYDDVGRYVDGFCFVSKNGEIGFLDRNGNAVIFGDYSLTSMVDGAPYPFMINGYAALCKNNKCGILDSLGNIIFPFKYDDISWINDGLCIAELNKKFAILNLSSNKEITLFKYDNIIPNYFSKPWIVVINDKYGLINKNGEEITAFQYDFVEQFDGDSDKTKVNCGAHINERSIDDMGGKWGLVDINGKEILSLKYDKINIWSDGSITAKIGAQTYKFDKNGNEIKE